MDGKVDGRRGENYDRDINMLVVHRDAVHMETLFSSELLI